MNSKPRFLGHLFGVFLIVAMAGVIFTAWTDPGEYGSGIGSRSYVVNDANDTVTNSASFTNTDMTFPLEANKSVHVRYSLPFRLTGVSSGIKFQITAPTGFVAYSSAIVIYSVGDSVAFVQVGATPNAQGLSNLPSGSSIATVDLDIVNGSTAGNVTVQFAQNAAQSGQSTILLRGAYGEITRR